MSHQRCFTNRYPDFSGNLGNCDFVRKRIIEVLEKIAENCPSKSPKERDGGLYVGPAGIAYVFYYVATSGLFEDRRQSYLEKARTYIEVSVQDYKRMNPKSQGGIGASFLLGHAGVYTVYALIQHALGVGITGVRDFLQFQEICQPLGFFPPGSDELFVGRAGYLCAALALNKQLGSEVVPPSVTQPLCNTIVESGKKYSREHRSASPLMYAYYATEYVGAGHGLSSILQILLCYPQFFNGKPEIESTLKQAVDFVLACEKNGDYPPVGGESQMLVHWCHGAAGVVYLLVKAYLTWHEDKYLQAALRCGEVVWERGLLRKGPGICHGIAGSGYVFLLLYRLTRQDKYLYRACKFAEFMETETFKEGARTPDCPYSLFEGLAGTVCFYVDLLRPSQAAFPFFDVFA